MVRQMDAEGHELGNHSWSHTYPDNMSGYDEEMKEYLDCSDIMEKVVGYRPKGCLLYTSKDGKIHCRDYNILQSTDFSWQVKYNQGGFPRKQVFCG